MPETRPNSDWEELGSRLRALTPLIDDLHDDDLGPLYREYLRVGEYDFALEVVVALERMHPEVVNLVTSQLPEEKLNELDPEVIAGLEKLARRGYRGEQ